MPHKIGLGYDIHRLVAGRKLFLGGVDIPHPKGLEGHSDADVLLHALCDAMLGALALGDIGEHFPNTDARFKGISSLRLLHDVYALVLKSGFLVGNVDVMVLAEEPRLNDFKLQMRQNISNVLKMDLNCVSIKATTQEGVGFGSTHEAIAAHAVVLLEKVSSRFP